MSDQNAWEDEVYWPRRDRTVLGAVGSLRSDILRCGTATQGIGKPEPLRHGFHGYWSRRITDVHRLGYSVVDGRIAACRDHDG